MNEDVFQKLKKLAKNRKITIGVDRNHANNLWNAKTVWGRILNLLSLVLLVFVVIIFIKFGFVKGVLSIIGVGFYSLFVQYIAAMYTRITLLNGEAEIFESAYQIRLVTIKNNLDGKMCSYPDNLSNRIKAINELVEGKK